jgi:hypothetical protein
MDSAPVVALPTLSFAPILPVGDLLTLVFYITIAAYAIFTVVLYYHWNAYASDKKVTTVTYLVYFVMTIPLVLTMATSAFIL